MAIVLALGFVGLFYVNHSCAHEDFVSHSGDNLDLRYDRSLLQTLFHNSLYPVQACFCSKNFNKYAMFRIKYLLRTFSVVFC